MTVQHLASGAYLIEAETWKSVYDVFGKRIDDTIQAPYFLLEEHVKNIQHKDCLCALRAQIGKIN